MASITTYLIFVGILLVLFAFENRRNPDRLNKLWQTFAVALTFSSLWFLQDRISSFSSTLGYSWVFTLGLVALIGFVLWGIFTRKPF